MTTETLTDLDKTLAEQVQKTLDMFRPILQSEGGDARLAAVKDGVATITLDDSGCEGCGSTPLSVMAPGIKRTILEKVDSLKDIVFQQPQG